MNAALSIIRPETVAAKQAALQNLQAPAFRAALAREPRLVELAWFIQAQSLQPGGLETFAASFLAFASDRVGTPTMRRLGKIDQPYTAAERMAVIEEFPGETGQWDMKRTPSEVAIHSVLAEFTEETRGRYVSSKGTLERVRPNLAFISKQNHAYFFDHCQRCALASLPWILADFCAQPDAVLTDPFYFHDLTGALLDAMDAHAARVQQTIAITKVTTDVFDALEFAWSERAMVEIIGDARLGKTEAFKNFCAACPGRARLVKTPCDNCDRSLLEAIAEAAGIEVTLKMTFRQLKARVEYVLKHSGLMFVFDEAAWLIPQRYTAKTTPMRLNYIRSQLLENGCPVALVTTPQLLDTASKSYERVTGFNMAQWRGRIMRTVQLPSDLPEADLLAVVKIHFPDLKETYARRIVAAALISESFLFAVEKIAKNARAEARKNGRAQIEFSDLESGIRLAGITVPGLTPPAALERPPRAIKRADAAPARSVTPPTPAANPAPDGRARSPYALPQITRETTLGLTTH